MELKTYNDFYKDSDWKNIPIQIMLYMRSLIKIIRWFDKNKTIRRVVDIGCGTGIHTKILSDQEFETVGIDFSEVAIAKAQQKYPKCNFQHQDAKNLELNHKFDMFFSKGFSLFNTNNVSEVYEILQSWKKYLQPKGLIVIISRTDFSKRSPNNWYFHSEEEIKNLYTHPDFEFNIYYIYSKLQYFLLLPIITGYLLKTIHWFSKKIIIEKLKKPVNYFVILKLK